MTGARAPLPRRICLVTAGNVSSRPRLVKAADALQSAGHQVHVLALDIQPDHGARDDAMMRGRAWALTRVPLRRGSPLAFVRRGFAAAGQAVALAAWRLGIRSAVVADVALSRYRGPLTRAGAPSGAPSGAASGADLVVAHGVEALPIAARIAERLDASLGFDSEDLHTGELPDDTRHESRRALVAAVEGRYLARCSYVTAASRGIADALVQSYGIRPPLVVPNTFPRSERPPAAMDGRAGPPGPASLYWYSQVIGEGRGLEDAVEALPLIGGAVQLHLRGHADPSYVRKLIARARALGVDDRVVIWPVAEPGELVRLAATHDIGLALEQRSPRNRDLCVTNKLYVYLLAGLAVAASDTSGQRDAMTKAPGAGFLYPPGDVHALAAGVRALLETPMALTGAKAAARRAADEALSWEHDAPRLVAYLTTDDTGDSRSASAGLADRRGTRSPTPTTNGRTPTRDSRVG